MRDQRFVAEHRGGPLAKAQHYQLIEWACDCSRHVLHLYGPMPDSRLTQSLRIAKLWKQGKASVGQARKASTEAIAVAREAADESARAVARSVGHAVATAHMADHALGAAWYGLKAVKAAGRSIEEERDWQDGQLPDSIKKLVLTARAARKLS